MARFSVLYSLAATDIEDAARQAFEIAVEQTIEFPYDLVTNRFIRDEVTGKVESVDGPLPENGRFRVLISYDEATCDDEFTQFLNVVFGNTSMKPGVRVESINPTVAQLAAFRGPGFGVQGIRDIIGVRDRPLLC